MIVNVKFKTQRQEEEFPLIVPELRGFILDVAWYVWQNYKRPVVITDLLRTQAEQDAIYGKDVRYQERPWKSVHQFKRGADIRSHGLTHEQTAGLLRYIAVAWPYDPNKPEMHSAIIHDVSRGLHIHLQVKA